MKKQILLSLLVLVAVNAPVFGMFRGPQRFLRSNLIGVRFSSASNARYGFASHGQAHEKIMALVEKCPHLSGASQVRTLAFLKDIADSKREYRPFVDELEAKRKQVAISKQIDALMPPDKVAALIYQISEAQKSGVQEKTAAIEKYKAAREKTENGSMPIEQYIKELVELEKAYGKALKAYDKALKEKAELQKKLNQRSRTQKLYDYCCNWFTRS